MQRRLYNDDTQAGMRAAKRLSSKELAIARARIGVMRQLRNAKSLLDDVNADLNAAG